MLRNLLRRAGRYLLPASRPEIVLGTRPGYVWWPEQHCWVDEMESYKPGGRSYAVIGPLYSAAHGQP